MPLLTVTPLGAHGLRLRVRLAAAGVPHAIGAVVPAITAEVTRQLAAAAPVGAAAVGGPPPGGDAPGSLAESFHAMVSSEGGVARGVVTTSQPTKLRYVVEGTGVYGPRGRRIVPVTKRALMWPGAAHPVRSVAGMRPRDFVRPVMDQAAVYASARLREAMAGPLTILRGE